MIEAWLWVGGAAMASLESPVNQPLTRLVKEVLGGALAAAVGVGGGEGGAACGEGGSCGCAGACGGRVDDVTVPALAAGAGAGGGGDPEPVNPVSEEHPAKAVSAIMPAIIVRKLRHSVPSLAPGSCPKSPRPRISQSL